MTREFTGALGAIGFGALIGALIALSIDLNGVGYWVIGALVGGATAYLSYEFQKVNSAICRVFTSIPHTTVAVARGTWAIMRMVFSLSFWGMWASYTLGTLLAIGYVIAILVTLWMIKNGASAVVSNGEFIGTFVVGLFFSFFIGTAWAIQNYFDPLPADAGPTPSQMRTFALLGNPLTIVFVWLPHGIWYGLFRPIWRHGPRLVAIFYANCVEVIRLIHNEVRVLCFLYGNIGATVGYFVGQILQYRALGPIVGAIVGMGLAALSHEIAIRSAKTVPISRS